jgi:hypothetical protein
MPVPVRLTLRGLAASGLAPIATDADSEAAMLGLKVAPTLHDEPLAPSVAPHGVGGDAVRDLSLSHAEGRLSAVSLILRCWA